MGRRVYSGANSKNKKNTNNSSNRGSRKTKTPGPVASRDQKGHGSTGGAEFIENALPLSFRRNRKVEAMTAMSCEERETLRKRWDDALRDWNALKDLAGEANKTAGARAEKKAHRAQRAFIDHCAKHACTKK